MNFLLFFTIFMGALFECYSYYFRSLSHLNIVYSTVISNWILYFSRIFNVFTLIQLAILIESHKNNTLFIDIFLFSYLFSAVYIYFILFKFKYDLIFYIFLFIIKKLYKINYSPSTIIENNITSYKLLFCSFFISFFIFISLVAPSIFAYKFYDHRLSLSYVSSFFNFFASALLLSYLEPLFAKRANSEYYYSSFYTIFIGKIISYVVISLFCLTISFII